jgi:hypothetical protein
MGNVPWDDQAEADWSKWVGEIGDARAARKCLRLNDCINNASINRLKKPTDGNLNVFADCADVPMELRAYFAVKTGRPFQYVSGIGGSQYSANNKPSSFADARQYSSVQSLLSAISSNVHSGHFRMKASVEGSDTYPVNVTRSTVKPGTVYYDPNGHVLVVYRVDPNGTIRLMDGHPDNSLTIQIFGEKFAVGSAAQGGGFRRFRPYTFDGTRFTRTPNDRLKDSANGWGEQQYGRGQGYYEWVRSSLSNGTPLDPVNEMKELSNQLCVDLQDRAAAVSAASGVANGPLGSVPPNIYGAEGEWEALSTPSRDARFKASFRGMHRMIAKYAGPGSNTATQLGQIWKSTLASCKITYKNSAGAQVTVTLADAEKRLFDMSFDPYHCPEMRWGAYPSQAGEMSTCRTSAAHMKRFNDERTQRNAIDREYGAPTPFSWGPAQPEDVSVSKLLKARGGL